MWLLLLFLLPNASAQEAAPTARDSLVSKETPRLWELVVDVKGNGHFGNDQFKTATLETSLQRERERYLLLFKGSASWRESPGDKQRKWEGSARYRKYSEDQLGGGASITVLGDLKREVELAEGANAVVEYNFFPYTDPEERELSLDAGAGVAREDFLDDSRVEQAFFRCEFEFRDGFFGSDGEEAGNSRLQVELRVAALLPVAYRFSDQGLRIQEVRPTHAEAEVRCTAGLNRKHTVNLLLSADGEWNNLVPPGNNKTDSSVELGFQLKFGLGGPR